MRRPLFESSTILLLAWSLVGLRAQAEEPPFDLPLNAAKRLKLLSEFTAGRALLTRMAADQSLATDDELQRHIGRIVAFDCRWRTSLADPDDQSKRGDGEEGTTLECVDKNGKSIVPPPEQESFFSEYLVKGKILAIDRKKKTIRIETDLENVVWLRSR